MISMRLLWEESVVSISTKMNYAVLCQLIQIFQCIQWQHPRFHAFFPCGRSYPDILAETLISSLGTVGITWVKDWVAGQGSWDNLRLPILQSLNWTLQWSTGWDEHSEFLKLSSSEDSILVRAKEVDGLRYVSVSLFFCKPHYRTLHRMPSFVQLWLQGIAKLKR